MLPPLMFMAHEPQIPEETQSQWVNEICHKGSCFHYYVQVESSCSLCLTFTTGASECERGVDLILNLNECIQNHWTTAIYEEEYVNRLQRV